MRKLVGPAIWCAVSALWLATASRLLSHIWTEGSIGWALDLLSHWPKHLALAGLAVGVLAAVRRNRLAAGAAIAVAALNSALVFGLGSFTLPQKAPDGARLVRIVSANVHRSMAALERVTELARSYDADIVAVYEVPDDLTNAQFAAMLPDLQMRATPRPAKPPPAWLSDRDPTYDSALAVRRAATIETGFYDGSRGVLMSSFFCGVRITTTHPPSPGDPDAMFDRDRQLSDIATGIDTAAPFIIAGDFNATPWGRIYDVVPGARAGDPRLEGTFPSFLGPLGLPIDHIRFGGGLVLTDYRVGPDIGSDHLPLFATFALPAR